MVEEKVKGNLRVCGKIDMWGWMYVELCGSSLSLSLRFSPSNGNFLFHLFVRWFILAHFLDHYICNFSNFPDIVLVLFPALVPIIHNGRGNLLERLPIARSLCWTGPSVHGVCVFRRIILRRGDFGRNRRYPGMSQCAAGHISKLDKRTLSFHELGGSIEWTRRRCKSSSLVKPNRQWTEIRKP